MATQRSKWYVWYNLLTRQGFWKVAKKKSNFVRFLGTNSWKNRPISWECSGKPSFLQHNLRLVISGHCLHVSVTKFQDKFTSEQQVNSPNSWDKFQKCCTDMYFIRFLLNFMYFCEFCGISRIYLNFAAPRPREISEALTRKAVHLSSVHLSSVMRIFK